MRQIVIKKRSFTVSVDLALGPAEFAGDKAEHGDKAFGVAIAASFVLGGLEDAVESLRDGVGQPTSPIGQNAL
jgi:hypothetical protein